MMTEESVQIHNTAASKISSIFGVLGGLGGIVHGVGEVLQGNVLTDSFFFSSWTQGPIAIYLDGDPAFSLIPNLLITGILTLLFSAATIIYALLIYRNKIKGRLLIILSIIMLLVGGGVGPPILTLLAGLAALGVGSSYLWWRQHLPRQVQRVFTMIWPWVFGLCVGNGVFLVVGHVIAVYFFAPVSAVIFQNSFFFAVVLLALSIITGIAHDISNQDEIRA